MTWFERLTGFAELSPQQVRENLVLDGEMLRSRVNGRELVWGRLELPSLGGGVFGNEMGWILGAIERALGLYRAVGLEVAIVSYGRSNAAVRALVDRF